VAVIDNTRSYKRGQVSRAELVAAIRLFREAHKKKSVTAAIDEIESYVSDILIVDGDLHVHGDLDLTDEGIYVLMVLGDLTVDGVYGDSDDPESMSLVTGNMKARDVVTAGFLEVHGDLDTGRLIGDYNDCDAIIGGDVRASLFYGEEHFFTIGGALVADAVIGTPRLEIAKALAVIDLDDPRLLEHFDRDLLRVYEEDGEVQVDGLRDFREVKRRVNAGLPLRSG
jgi:hypothetical protein